MTTEACWFCTDEDRRDRPPGGWIYEDALWRVGHAPATYGPAGLTILEARRHVLDLAEMTPDEAARLGPLLGRLIGAIKRTTGASRVYLFSTMARVPHFHAMLIPWWPDQAARGPDYVANMPPCSQALAERTAADLRIALAGSRREVDALAQGVLPPTDWRKDALRQTPVNQAALGRPAGELVPV